MAAARYGQKIRKFEKVLVSKEKIPSDAWIGWTNKGKSVSDFKEQYRVKYIDESNVVSRELTFLEKEEIYKIVGKKNISKIDNLKLKPEMLGSESYMAEHIRLDKPIIIGSGKGKAQLYDQAIPSFMKKYGKKWNAKVYDEKFKTQYVNKEKTFAGPPKEMPVTILEITPAMKKAVQEGSQSLFEILGIATSGAVATKAVSDNQRNNTISNLTN